MSWSRFFVSLDIGAKNVGRALKELESDIANDKLGKPTEERVEKTEKLLEDVRDNLEEIERTVNEI